jgi:L-cystine transport system permease protein
MSIDFAFLLVALKAGLMAVPVTAGLSLSAFVISLVIGSLIATARFFEVPLIAPVLRWIIDILKAIPSILILYILYFTLTDGITAFLAGLGRVNDSGNISVNMIAVAALSVSGSVTISETIRGAFNSVGRGQYDGAYSVGLTWTQTLWRIILPQVLPTAIPILCNNLIVFIKNSSLMYFISVMDILNASLIPASSNYKFLDAYIAAALIYWGICLIIEQVSKLLERYLSRFRRMAV